MSKRVEKTHQYHYGMENFEICKPVSQLYLVGQVAGLGQCANLQDVR